MHENVYDAYYLRTPVRRRFVESPLLQVPRVVEFKTEVRLLFWKVRCASSNPNLSLTARLYEEWPSHTTRQRFCLSEHTLPAAIIEKTSKLNTKDCIIYSFMHED